MDHRPAPGVPRHRQQHRLFAFYHLAAYTGARRGELLNLRWQDIDLDGKKITITGSTAVIGGQRVDGTTKSGRSRVVSIDAETVAVLRQRKADQAAEQLKAGDSWRGAKDGYVFTTGWERPRRRCSSTCRSRVTSASATSPPSWPKTPAVTAPWPSWAVPWARGSEP